MSVELIPVTILNTARVAQYIAANETAAFNDFKGNSFDQRIARLIYMERRAVQIRFDQNPNDPTLVATSNYLYALLGKFGILAQIRLAGLTIPPPVITGPFNQSVLVGANGVFSTTVVSGTPATYQWYDQNNNPILGANSTTYTFLNAQLTDSGKTFYMKATNQSGTVTSTIAVLVVSAQIQVFAWYGVTDPFPALSGGTDNLPYQIIQTITHNAPITITWPSAAANDQFEVIKIPATESVKTIWLNTALNQGTIPDATFRQYVTIGTNNYIISRTAMSLDATVLTETFS